MYAELKLEVSVRPGNPRARFHFGPLGLGNLETAVLDAIHTARQYLQGGHQKRGESLALLGID